jgi:POT family proton-dependent oligopeptide transporter
LGAGPFTPEATARLGTSVAFAIPGVLMFLATLIFWMGRRKFVHVPAKPGGKLGLLDTLSSTALFMSLGHLFFTASQPWWVILLATVGFLGLGLALFAARQRLAPDDGFLAILLFTLVSLVRGDKDPARGGRETADEGAAVPTDSPPPLAQSNFWGPAVRRFGLDAAEGPVAVLKIMSILFFICVFWALFDQHATTWIEQARKMDLTMRGYDQTLSVTLPGSDRVIGLPATILPNQIQALNPMLVMLMIPLVNLLYRGCDWLRIPSPMLARMTVGMFVTAGAFVAAALLQQQIDAEAEGTVWWLWQTVPYVLLTTGEIMVSITALELAYTQAPKRMKSTIMSFLNLTITMGNVLVALLTYFAGLPPAKFFWVFAWLMAGAGVLFGLRSYFYVPKEYPQE